MKVVDHTVFNWGAVARRLEEEIPEVCWIYPPFSEFIFGLVRDQPVGDSYAWIAVLRTHPNMAFVVGESKKGKFAELVQGNSRDISSSQQLLISIIRTVTKRVLKGAA